MISNGHVLHIQIDMADLDASQIAYALHDLALRLQAAHVTEGPLRNWSGVVSRGLFTQVPGRYGLDRVGIWNIAPPSAAAETATSLLAPLPPAKQVEDLHQDAIASLRDALSVLIGSGVFAPSVVAVLDPLARDATAALEAAAAAMIAEDSGGTGHA